LFHRVQRDRADFANRLNLSKESKYPMVIRIEEGWTMVQEATGQARKADTTMLMKSNVKTLNPAVLITAEWWFPGQRLRMQDQMLTVSHAIDTWHKQTSAVDSGL
jgi:hypothetical protein